MKETFDDWYDQVQEHLDQLGYFINLSKEDRDWFFNMWTTYSISTKEAAQRFLQEIATRQSNMDYSIYLPSHFSSWYEFYENEKPRIHECQEDLYIKAYPRGVFPASMAQIETYRYSIQYIKNQTLEELYSLRRLQTFEIDELRWIYKTLQLSIQAGADSPELALSTLQVKVAQLLYSLKKKRRLGL